MCLTIKWLLYNYFWNQKIRIGVMFKYTSLVWGWQLRVGGLLWSLSVLNFWFPTDPLLAKFIHYPTFLVGGKNLNNDCQPKQLANKINHKQLILLNSSSGFEIRQHFQLFTLAYLEGGDDKARVAASFAFLSADSCASEEERNLRSSCTLLSNWVTACLSICRADTRLWTL